MTAGPASAARLVLRADGNGRIGLGHVMRLLALADALRADFTEIVFLTQAPAPGLAALTQATLTVVPLPAEPPAHEASQVLPALLRPTDVLVLDGYHFDLAYQTQVRPLVASLVCLDDLHAFPFAADLVLNPAGGVAPAAYDLRAPHARVLAGPAYAPLRADFRPGAAPALPAAPATVLLCLGGADPQQRTLATTAALLALPGVAQVHAVVGSAFGGWEALRNWSAGHAGRVQLHRALAATELASLMRQCGAAVLSPSTISYEYCAAGGGLLFLLPTAANQHDLHQFLLAAGLALPYAAAANVLSAHEAPRLAQQLRQAQRRHFDGQAPQRLRQEFAALRLPATPLRLRPVQPADADQLLAWANDPETRRQSFRPELVAPAQHQAWLASRLAEPASHLLLLAEAPGAAEAVGLIRFALADADADDAVAVGPVATLSYVLGPAYRGRGWAAPLLLAGTRAAVAHWPQAAQVLGEVKAANVASVRAFERAGFAEVAGSGPAGSRTFAWTAVPAA